MKKSQVHTIIISLLVLIILIAVFLLVYIGYGYYATSLEDRYFHTQHQVLKASGIVGHGLGIVGSLMIVFGVFSYMARKRIRRFSRIGILKYWLEMHIFFCVLGPILILFHTSFKFGGIVAVSFWSMVIVVLSGVIGRFIYLQIPRTIEGRQMSRLELDDLKLEMNKQILSSIEPDSHIYELLDKSAVKSVGGIFGFIWKSKQERKAIKQLKILLKEQEMPENKYREIVRLYKKQNSLGKRIDRLVMMQNLFKYWHVAHLPFALIMLVIMIIHIAVALTFGYTWIF